VSKDQGAARFEEEAEHWNSERKLGSSVRKYASRVQLRALVGAPRRIAFIIKWNDTRQ